MKYEYMIRTLVLSAAAALCVFAQAPAEPFPLVRLIRNPGRAGQETAAISQYADSKAMVNVLGLVAVTGTLETLFIEGHDSFASIEAVDTGLAAAGGGATQREAFPVPYATVALFRPGLSYRPEEAIQLLPKARYLNITTYRIRTGSDREFAELMRLRRAGLDAVNLDRPEMAYQVISGAQAGTYVFLTPLVSLKQIDNGVVRTPAYAEVITEAGAAEGRKIAAQIEMSREASLFRMEPRFSYVSEEFAAQGGGFWAPKRSGQ